jgi:hypothetical protein
MIPASTPSATMFGQASGIPAASAFQGAGAWRAPLRAKTSGGAPCAGSPTMRLSGPSGSSAAKRATFCQSIAASTWKASSWPSPGKVDTRSIAAASPPRICGPLVRVIRP